LITDNPLGISLQNSIEVKRQHQFLNGLITSASRDTYIAYEDGTQIIGASDQNHVIGWVRKSGSADFTFPVGDSQFLRTVTIRNLSQPSWFAVSYEAPGFNPTQVAAPLFSAHPNEFWWINRLQGGSATVELNWEATKVPMPFHILNDLRGGYYQNQVWNNRGGLVSGDVLTSGTVLLHDQNEFGAYAVATIGSLVPLKLLSFTGERKKGYSALYWTSANESASSKFIIERSEDALHFVRIGEVEAQHQANQNNYGFNDYLPLSGTGWYRLYILDQSGTGFYSKVIALRESDKGQLSLLNNPASGFLYLSSGNAQSGLYAYQLLSVSGQLYQRGQLEIRGNAVTTLPLRASLRSGLYILTLQKDQFRFTKQVVIQ
ncbi:MAG: T9SS type A sorting domain-containing protein, partial [Chitinophagaceae bacterium]